MARKDPKQAYYISMEFLQGRALLNALGNLDITSAYAQALKQLGYDLETIADQEPDAALGNGGLGRLASCFLDSLATLNLPAGGYGLRYKHGLFRQSIDKAGQHEEPENWLEMGHPWEVQRHGIVYPIQFFGEVQVGEDGKRRWVGGEKVLAQAYDVPIPGYKTKNTISLRLWSAAVPAEYFQLEKFNNGEYEEATKAWATAEQICAVLYPGDGTEAGKLLRLKQQYMLCSASVQDIVKTFLDRRPEGSPVNWSEFPEKVAIQMNDTHPTLAAPELMRLLLDREGLGWDEAWSIVTKTVNYTNHTVLPEALEKWPLPVFSKLLPRHLEIIAEIDKRFIASLREHHKSASKEELADLISRLRILGGVLSDDEKELGATQNGGEPPKQVVRMANLCVIAAQVVNGVAQIHSDIVKNETFNDFYKMWPQKFQNKTNGVTPRRWLKFANPKLSAVISKWLGSDEWVTDTTKLTGLRKFADDKKLHEEWVSAKKAAKEVLAGYIKDKIGVTVNPNALFDIQIKRIHEYKRQLLNILGVVYRYKQIKAMSPEERAKVVPRVCMFGGKAFATYTQAKRIVKLVTDVGSVVNNDKDIGDLVKVVFLTNYNVTVAETAIPASELSQHISTAGMEASGTSNMKFALNGCLIIGTLDGANVEIREQVGEENFFLFGITADEVPIARKEREEGKFVPDPRFVEACNFVRSKAFGDYDYQPLLDSLEGNSGFGRGDYFLVGRDFATYLEAQKKVDEAYLDQDRWARMSIMSTAGSGVFSSDRTIKQYADEIWKIKPLKVE
eukprot:TRINITY_DN1221_c0_g2_i1.p1 TRINITY_DN1221_c0_g2~~TRINITY_DN1221_c0_g2_i1.p1  ORF type:complete len:830 (+),score=323.47 TRINITY_DN1221_c0_g2_i1:131-2491(+)